MVAAICSINDIKYLQRLSLETAKKIFNTKVLATVTYGLELIWEYLTRKQLSELENLKARFLKRALGLSKYTASRLVYVLARETLLLDDLRLKLLLPCTESLQVILRELEAKRDGIPAEFYITDAMTSDHWKCAGYDMGHIVTRFAVHGFHHGICKTKCYHQPGRDCVCERCGKPCDTYHAMNCQNRGESLTQFCSNLNL